MEQEPKQLTREEKEKAIKAVIRRKEKRYQKYRELAESEEAEIRELWLELQKSAQEEVAEINARIAKQNAAIDEIQGAVIEKNRPKLLA